MKIEPGKKYKVLIRGYVVDVTVIRKSCIPFMYVCLWEDKGHTYKYEVGGLLPSWKFISKL